MTESNFLDKAKFKKIICFGCGDFGKRFLDKYGDKINVAFFWDNSDEKQGTKWKHNGKEYCILKPVKDKLYASEQYVIVITSSYWREIQKQLKEMGYGNVFCFPFVKERKAIYEECLRKNILDRAAFNHWDAEFERAYAATCHEKNAKGKFVIPYLPVMITTRCTLKCEYCNNLMPYFKDKACDSAVEGIIENIEKVAAISGEILFLELVGGEPLLHKGLGEILSRLAKIKNIGQLILVTNGTVIPDEVTTDLLKEYNVLIRVSDYGFLEKIVSFVRYAEANGLNIWVTASDWMYPGELEKCEKSDYELAKQFERCFFTMQCKYLYEGKMFHCARAASLYALGYLKEEEGLSLNKASEKEVKEFYLDTYYTKACEYCHLFTDNTKTITAGKQMNRDAVQSGYTVITREEWMEFQKIKEENRYRGE